MSYRITITEQAKADIRGIFEYIANELQSLEVAAGQLERLETSIYSLQNMPDRFRRYNKEPWCSRGLRVMPVDNYIVFYISNHEQETVHIIRVMYSGRDIDTQLKKHTKI